MPLNYTVKIPRGANLIDAQPQRLESPDGKRWACGRNVKVSVGYRRYDAAEVWSLRTRDANGKVAIVATHRSREEAQKWVSAQGPAMLRQWVQARRFG